jgi:hypothetical protein
MLQAARRFVAHVTTLFQAATERLDETAIARVIMDFGLFARVPAHENKRVVPNEVIKSEW